MTHVLRFLTVMLITGTLVGVSFYGILTFSQLQTEKIKNQAIDGCLNTSIYRNTTVQVYGSSIVTEEPIQTAVDKCLQLKGY